MELNYRSKDVQISDYFRVLFRRRVVVLLTFLAVFFSVLIHTFLMTPIYEAYATVQIKDEQTQTMLLGEIGRIGRANAVRAEMEIIRSRTIAEAVVRELLLDLVVVDQSDDLEVRLRNVNLPLDERGRTFDVHFLDDQRFEISYKGDKLGQGTLTEGFHTAGIHFDVETAAAEAGSSFKFVQRPFAAVVRMVQTNLDVVEVGDRTQIVRISYRSQHSQLAREIVNQTVEVYRQNDINQKTAEAQKTVQFINDQLEQIYRNLEDSEKALQEYKKSKGIMQLSVEAGSLIDSLAKFDAQRSQLEIERYRYASMLQAVEKIGVETASLPSLSSAEDTVLASLGQKLAELKSQKNALLTELTDEHPSVKALTQEIESLGAQVGTILAQTLKTIDSRLGKLDQVLKKYTDQISDLPGAERDMAELLRSTEVTSQIYILLLEKREEARIAQASKIGNIRVIDTAVTPHSPIKPNIRLNLLLGIVAGLLLAVGVAFFLEFIDDSLKSIEEVERFVRKPVFGIIPRIPDYRKDDEGVRSVASALVTHYSPKSPISEAFRTLRTNIHFADPDQKVHTLLITSAGPSEGKSTIVSNLALTFANNGRRTLLIDCDLRKPNVQNIFEINRDPGLTTLLLGEKPWNEVVRPSQIENLSILPSGPIPPNPTELLGSQHMKDVIAMLGEHFDFLLFDSPPVIAVTDAAILSSVVDATLLVVELGRSRGTAVNRAIDLLSKVNANLLGVVTNNIFAGYRYDYGYYSYYYYYAESGQKKKRRRRSRYGY
jgi:tyrosine-protein kinase Etk/Wzc